MNDFGKVVKFFVALTLGAAAALYSPAILGKGDQKKDQVPAAADGKPRVVEISITEDGYQPSPITLKKGEPVTLALTRKTEQTCATEIHLPEYKIEKPLPLNQRVEVTFTPDKTGKLKYGCAMNMMIAGVLIIE